MRDKTVISVKPANLEFALGGLPEALQDFVRAGGASIRVVDVQGKGKGVVTTRWMREGDLILFWRADLHRQGF